MGEGAGKEKEKMKSEGRQRNDSGVAWAAMRVV